MSNEEDQINTAPRRVSRRKFLALGSTAMAGGLVASTAKGSSLKEYFYAAGEPVDNSNVTSEFSLGFDQEQQKIARDNLAVVVLPIIYEKQLKKYNATPEQAKGAVSESLPKGSECEIFRHENTTAVVVHDPLKHQITVAYDATMEWRDILNNAHFTPHDFPSGGLVHTGYYNAIAQKDAQGRKISDCVKMQVEKYAAAQKGDTGLTMTGFSRGGALSELTLAQWFKEGLPAHTRLNPWQTFASPAWGDKECVENFDAACAKHGVRGSRIIAGNDIVPREMTKRECLIKMVMPAGDAYTQAGDVIYMMPRNDHSGTDILVNPGQNLLKFHLASLENRQWHDENLYADLLGASQAKSILAKNNKEQKPPPTSLAISQPLSLSVKNGAGR